MTALAYREITLCLIYQYKSELCSGLVLFNPFLQRKQATRVVVVVIVLLFRFS